MSDANVNLNLALWWPSLIGGLVRSMKYGCYAFFAAICPALPTHASFFPPQIIISASSNYVASLQTNPSESLVIHSNKIFFCEFAYKDFGIQEPSTINLRSTAGLLWYRESISFFDKAETHLVMRLRWGQFVVVNLLTKTISLDVSPELRSEADETVRRQVLTWLESAKAQEREKGAWYAGDLRLQEAVPRLKELTADSAKGEFKDGNAPWAMSYFVRKAAVNALKEFNIFVKDVVLEEPKQ